MQIDAVIAGSLPAGEPRRQFVWDLLLWDEATRELLRRHVDAIASGSDGPHELHVQSTGTDGPADLTLRSLQADNGNVRAIIVEATGIADPASDGQEMVPRQVVEDMAHQLNNALASILGNLELIERRSQDSEAVLARIPRAREALDRAFTLIQGMRK